MADACLSGAGLANRSAGRGASAEDAERANRPSLEGPDEGWVRQVATVQAARDGMATPGTTVRPPPPPAYPDAIPTGLAVASGGYPAPCSLGLHPLQRTRCGGQVGPALACLHRQPEAASWHDRTRPR